MRMPITVDRGRETYIGMGNLLSTLKAKNLTEQVEFVKLVQDKLFHWYGASDPLSNHLPAWEVLKQERRHHNALMFMLLTVGMSEEEKQKAQEIFISFSGKWFDKQDLAQARANSKAFSGYLKKAMDHG